MPYNLRSRKGTRPAREIRIPRRGDRVTIFWRSLGTSYSGRLTKYDPVHATFLVVYDRTPAGFDDHRIWEALDLVPWRFDCGGGSAGAGSEEDSEGDEVGSGWFYPGELGNAHPLFRPDESAMDSESEDESEDDEDELDRSEADNGNCDRARGRIHEDDSLSTYNEDVRSTGRVRATRSAPQMQSDAEDEEEGERNLSAEPVEISMEQRDTVDITQPNREERHAQQLHFDVIRQPESNSEDSMKDSLYHPPLASKRQASKRTASQPAGYLHSEVATQVRRGRNLQTVDSKHSEKDSDYSSTGSLCYPPLAPRRQAPRRTASQHAERFVPQVEQQVRRGPEPIFGSTGESGNDPDESLKDSLYIPPLAPDQDTQRRISSQSAQQHPRRDRRIQRGNDAEETPSQPDQHQKQWKLSAQRAPSSGFKKELMDSLYCPPLAHQQTKSRQRSNQRGDQRQENPVRASKRERRYYSRGLVHKLQTKKMKIVQHGFRAAQRESDGIFNESLYEPPLAPKRKVIRTTSHNVLPQTERELQDGEQQSIVYERMAQQDPGDIMENDLHHVPLVPNRQETIQNPDGDSANSHLMGKRRYEPARESKFTSTHIFKDNGFHGTMASKKDTMRSIASNPAQTRSQERAESQGNRAPQTRRRYANFGPPGFSRFNRIGNASNQESNNPVQSYPRDTVHVNVSRQLRHERERRLSHLINHDTFRVSTGHHVLHSDIPSVEDQIKCITKTLGVADDASFVERK